MTVASDSCRNFFFFYFHISTFHRKQFASEPQSSEIVTDCFLRRSHLQDLKDVTHNIHYETYRVRRLNESNMNFSELVLTSWPLKNGTDTCETESQL